MTINDISVRVSHIAEFFLVSSEEKQPHCFFPTKKSTVELCFLWEKHNSHGFYANPWELYQKGLF